MEKWWENTWSMDMRTERARHERNANRAYKTERGLWLNQHSGSQEIDYVRETQLFESIAEYKRSNDWN